MRAEVPGWPCAYTVAAVAFALVNLPFAVWNWRLAARRSAPTLAQGAIPLGRGLIGITVASSAVARVPGLLQLRCLLYAVSAVHRFVFFFRRLGPAVTILPWTISSSRSGPRRPTGFLLVALFVASLLTTDRAVIDHAHHQVGGRLRQAPATAPQPSALAVTVLFAPTAACLAIAMGATQHSSSPSRRG